MAKVRLVGVIQKYDIKDMIRCLSKEVRYSSME